jgi:hypothetical protein
MNDPIKKVLYIAAFLLVIMGGQWFIETMGEVHYEVEKATHVFDLAHKYLPDLHDWQWIINIIPVLVIVYVIALPDGSRIFRDTFFMFILVLALRTLTAMSTILPKHDGCEVGSKFWNIFQGGGCYDKIFSGHTALVTLLLLNLLRAGCISLSAFWGLSAAEAATILLTRGHYTVDVVLGFLISYLVWDGDYTVFKGLFKGLTD